MQDRAPGIHDDAEIPAAYGRDLQRGKAGPGPGGDAEGTQRCELGRAGRPARELALAEGAHEQDAEAEVEERKGRRCARRTTSRRRQVARSWPRNGDAVRLRGNNEVFRGRENNLVSGEASRQEVVLPPQTCSSQPLGEENLNSMIIRSSLG